MARTAKKRQATAASSADGTPKAKRQKATKTPDPCVPPPGPSLFLALPAELRNLVYSYAAGNVASAVLRPQVRGKLLTQAALNTVSKQVSQDFQAMLYLSVPGVTAYVKDFDFGHVVTFLNKLSAAEMGALSTLTVPTERKVSIKLEVTKNCPHNPESLHRWLTRCEHPTKKGTQIDVTYTAEGDDPTGQVWDSCTHPHMHRHLHNHYTPRTNASEVRETLRLKLSKLGEVDKGRVYQEPRKIWTAVDTVL
ncbi:hypothetical protein LTR85_003360 [Meristemomyces frigidus]|nr:hypothetical protein LTR85_003360 [Meristemomyces frigidus]